MITAYYRPSTIAEAIALLSQTGTIPLGGGTFINSPAFKKEIAVVDLQALGLTHIHKRGNNLEIESCLTLQKLLENEFTPEALRKAIKLEAPLNIRNMATIAGALLCGGGRSPFVSAMLALDAKISIDGDKYSEAFTLGDLLPFRSEMLPGKLITKVAIPSHAKLAYEQVARTPADKPIVCASLVQWPSGRTRLVLGGWGNIPTLALDGNETDSLEAAARNAAHGAQDEWASAAYRSDIASILAKRCLDRITSHR